MSYSTKCLLDEMSFRRNGFRRNVMDPRKTAIPEEQKVPIKISLSFCLKRCKQICQFPGWVFSGQGSNNFKGVLVAAALHIYLNQVKKISHDKPDEVNMSRIVRKPAFCICENKDADQLRGYREADQRLCFRYTESTIPLLPYSEISSLQPYSVVAQPGLCWTWSETPNTGFLTTRFI